MLKEIPAARMVDQDMPHHLRAYREEVGPILPLDFLLSGQAQVGFIYQRGGPQGFAMTLTLHITMCDAPQLVVDQRS